MFFHNVRVIIQLYARNSEQQLIFSKYAAKQTDYFCIECQGVVRRRGGFHRHVHFYHLASSKSCRLNGKSMTHLQIQMHLQSLLPEGECELECRFPKIDRIADVVWWPQKLIFEVQYSPISAEEVNERNADYRSQGFQVVWILHDHLYNQVKVSAAEQLLLDSPHYFTDINAEGIGQIYDHFAYVSKGMRKIVLPRMPVQMEHPQQVNKEMLEGMPKSMMQRIKNWPVYFSGDLLDVCMANPRSEEINAYISRLFEAEQIWMSSLAVKRGMWIIRWLVKLQRLYWLSFQLMLERSCK